MKIAAICGAAVATMLACTSTASAARVQIILSGNTENINDFQNVFGLGGETVGSAANITSQAFTETFIVDTAGGNVVDTPTFVSYNSIFGNGPPYALSGALTINGHTFSTLGSNFSSISASAADFQGGSNDVVPLGPRLNNDISFDIHSSIGVALPASVIAPFTLAIDGSSVQAYNSFADETSGGQYPDAIGTLNPTRLTITPLSAAPEPSSWALIIGGVGAIGVRLRATRRRSTRAAAA